MGIHADPWGSTRIHGDPRGSMGIHADPWGSTRDPRGIHADPCGSMGIHADPYGSTRIHMDRVIHKELEKFRSVKLEKFHFSNFKRASAHKIKCFLPHSTLSLLFFLSSLHPLSLASLLFSLFVLFICCITWKRSH